MKSVLVALALITTTLCTRADEGVRFTTITTWQQALDRAKAERKPIFLDAYTDWCAVMPSMETVEWLNEVNEYCNGMEEWANGTYLQTREKLRESKQFLKNIHAKWTGS